MLESITKQVFATAPGDTLYHYTSVSGLLGIVNSGVLRASDIRYMNDSTELRHTLDLMDHVFLGPTTNSELSMKSIELFLEQAGARPARGLSYCQIPYRQR